MATPRDVDVQYRRDDSAPPSKWRERILIFFLALAAVLIGVGIGYYFGQRSGQPPQPSDRAITSSASLQRDPEVTRKVLVMLQDELVENARLLKRRRESGQQALIDPSAPLLILKNDVWKVVANSNWIQELTGLDLMRTLVDAYRHIEEVKLLEMKRFETVTASGRPLAGDRESAQLVASALAKISPIAEKSIVEAAVQVERKLTATR